MRLLLVHRVDEIEGAPGEAAFIAFGRNPDGKEFCPQISGLNLAEADLALVVGIGAADVEVAIQKPLWGIGMGVHHDRRLVQGPRVRADCGARRGVLLGACKNRSESQK